MAVKILQEAFEQEVLQSELPVLVDFYSEACVPCKRMSPILSEIEEEYKDRLKVCKIEVYSSLDLIQRLEVTAAPTLIFYKSGEEKERRFGFLSKETIQEILNDILEN